MPSATRRASRARPTRPARVARRRCPSSRRWASRSPTDADDGAEIEGVTISPDAYSKGEVLRHRDFDRMTAVRAARRRAIRRPAAAAPRAPPHPPLRAPPARSARGPAGDVPPEPGHRRADEVGVAAADPRAAPAGRAVRHLGLDGAPLAAAAAVRAGAGADERGAHRVVRVRDAADAGDADHARPGPRPGARARRRHRHRLGRRDADRGVVPGLQPPLGAPDAADVRDRDRGLRRLGPRRPGAGRGRDRAAATQLPPPGVAQPARVGARLPAARGRHEGGLPVHRRLPRRGHAGVARAPRGDPRAAPPQGTARWGSAVTHATAVAPSLGLAAPDAAPPRRWTPIASTPAAPGR